MASRRIVALVSLVCSVAVAVAACTPIRGSGPAQPLPTAGGVTAGGPASTVTTSAPLPPAVTATTTTTAAPSGAPSTGTAAASPAPPDTGAPGARHREAVFVPADVGTDVAVYGAVADDGLDDTAALRAALRDGRDDPGADYYGQPKRLVLAAGRYEISGTLDLVGCCVTFQGHGAGNTTLALVDGAAGFADPSRPSAMIRTIKGNMAFRNNVHDLRIETGSGNPGAVGLDFIGSNMSSIENVVIASGDGAGVAGLDMTREWPGPLLVQDLTVEGFEVGIAVAHREMLPTLERITLRGQSVAGIDNLDNTFAVRLLLSENSVPAIRSRSGDARPSIALLDSSLTGGGPGTSAVVAEGALLVRDVTAAGYASVVEHDGIRVAGLTVEEFQAGTTATSLFTAASTTLDLPVMETPDPADGDPATWAGFSPRGYNEDKDLVQALFDSGARTIYFPFDSYYLDNVIDVPPTVERIVGFDSVVNGDTEPLRLRVTRPSDRPLVVERFGYGVTVEHQSSRTVVVRHGNISYRSSPGAGPAFLEDVVHGAIAVQPGQQVWARQLNIENQPVHIDNAGGQLWVLGYKTEGDGVLAQTTAGGSTEIIGGLAYANNGVADRSRPAFRSVDGHQSLWVTGANYVAPGFYGVYVEQTEAGVTRRLPADDVLDLRLSFGTG